MQRKKLNSLQLLRRPYMICSCQVSAFSTALSIAHSSPAMLFSSNLVLNLWIALLFLHVSHYINTIRALLKWYCPCEALVG